MSTNAVSFLLLKKYRNGTTLEQLTIDLTIMRNQLSQNDRDVGFSGNSRDVVKHAVSNQSKLFTVFVLTVYKHFFLILA